MELDSQDSPGEIKKKKVELDSQESPGEIKKKVELDSQESLGEIKNREAEQDSHSRMDYLAADSFPNSCFSDTDCLCDFVPHSC